MANTQNSANHKVLTCSALALQEIRVLLHRYNLQTHMLPAHSIIPGSYWGAPEAGIIRHTVYIRPDTPVHSLLHETCHIICMDSKRRALLDTDAGENEYMEENAVCYLQILLAGHLSGFGQTRALADMDYWGYTFRLGSAQRWFTEDAEDARQWLFEHRLIDHNKQPTFRLRNT